jgi:hypothetical protein
MVCRKNTIYWKNIIYDLLISEYGVHYDNILKYTIFW